MEFETRSIRPQRPFNNAVSAYDPRNSDYREEQEADAVYFLDRAFLALRLFIEVKGISQMLQSLTADHQDAKLDFMRAESDPWGNEPSSFWAAPP